MNQNLKNTHSTESELTALIAVLDMLHLVSTEKVKLKLAHVSITLVGEDGFDRKYCVIFRVKNRMKASQMFWGETSFRLSKVTGMWRVVRALMEFCLAEIGKESLEKASQMTFFTDEAGEIVVQYDRDLEALRAKVFN
jgi:hypothetical protein